jgi:D-tyrosyl-tRNA(Tyr) deacylase
MRAVIQRVKESSVTIDQEVVARINAGLLVLIGVNRQDTEIDADQLAKKTSQLRIFEDEQGKMNCSLIDIGGEMLIVSQFTLYGDCRKGRRPSFIAAALPDQAEILYESFITKVKGMGVSVQTGRFGARMTVSLVNDGPVTLIVDTNL